MVFVLSTLLFMLYRSHFIVFVCWTWIHPYVIMLYWLHVWLWVMFSIYALLLSLYRVCVLDMHTSLCYCALLVACLNNHLLCYMIIVVISIWLSCVWSSCSYVSHYVCLIGYSLVTLYLSFYYLLYLESLMSFV